MKALRVPFWLLSGFIAGNCLFGGAGRADVIAAEAKDDHETYRQEEKPYTLPEQWYTGSLYSPSPALPEAGMLAVEPYVQSAFPVGRYDAHGHLDTRRGAQHNIEQYTLLKYGLTDRLSLYALPDYSYSWGNHTHHSGMKFSDFPVELEYRLTPHYTPSVSVYLGFIAPTGSYTNLANASEGVGTGAWFIRYGLHSQFALPFFKHAMRIRLWAQARQPVTGARLRNVTSYGTEKGFVGTGHPGAFGNEGGSLELGLTKRWVFALDLYHTWSASSSIRGRYRSAPDVYVHSRGSWSNTYNVGPAIEYSWTANVGGIAGVIVPVIGHNTTRNISPAVAVFALW